MSNHLGMIVKLTSFQIYCFNGFPTNTAPYFFSLEIIFSVIELGKVVQSLRYIVAETGYAQAEE